MLLESRGLIPKKGQLSAYLHFISKYVLLTSSFVIGRELEIVFYHVINVS